MSDHSLVTGNKSKHTTLQMFSSNDDINLVPNEVYRSIHFQQVTENRDVTWNNAIPPNDDLFNDQWPLMDLGNEADINVQEGWQIYQSTTANSQNGNEVIVAIVDSGVNFNHPDLRDAMWTNPGESCEFNSTHSCRDNGIDDDENGYIDDVHGWDFTEEDKSHLQCRPGEPTGAQCKPEEPMDTHGHGTHCAGIIYSRPNGGGEMGAGVASYTNGKVIY